MHRGRYNDRPDDVTSYKKLEAEQNRTADVLTIKRIVIAGVLDAMKDKPRSRYERATNNDEYTDAIDGGANEVHDLPIVLHGHVRWRNGQ